MIKFICSLCRKEFLTYNAHLRRKGKSIKNPCCSRKCASFLKQETQKGKGNPFYGKKHSKESIEKNKVSHVGQVAWNKGKTGIYSEETLKKMRFNRAKQVGEKHPHWQGGRRNFRGYVAIYSPLHPFKDKNNCVREHRLVMEKHLGRFLSKTETIHHVNGIKSDNRLENLKLFSSNQEHLTYHGKQGTIKGRPKKV